MDDADRAQHAIERELEHIVKSRASKTTYREYCDTCWEDLEDHRREFGRCVHCQSEVERKQKLGLG